ncbi:MAG: hydroxymethylglutaryl-CoA lyase [Gammaproteobacteria bacterium]
MAKVEAVSFVNPKRVPQMAEAETVLERIQRRPGCEIAGPPSMRGVERAIAAGVDEIRFAIMASETFNRRNQGVGIDDNIALFEAGAAKARAAGIRVAAAVGVAFGCPFEGEIPLQRVIGIGKRLAEAGADHLFLADTIGCAVPSQVRERFVALRDAVGERVPLGAHFHNTRNTGFANAYAALEAGVTEFDASVGGIGGCPFAPRATGNIASEDLLYLLRNMGYHTQVDLPALLGVAEWLQGFFEAPLPGQVMKAGLFPDIVRGQPASA